MSSAYVSSAIFISEIGFWGIFIAGISSRLSSTSTLDADERFHSRHLARQAGKLGGIDHRADILVCTGRLLGHAARRRAADQDTAPGQVGDHVAAAPGTRCLMPAHRAPRTVTCGTVGQLHALLRSGQYIRGCSHTTADQHRLAGIAQRRWQIGMPRAERTRGTLPMHIEFLHAPAYL